MLVPIGTGDMASIQTPGNIGTRNGDESVLVTLTGRSPGVMMHIVRGGTVAPSLIMGRRLAIHVHQKDALRITRIAKTVVCRRLEMAVELLRLESPVRLHRTGPRRQVHLQGLHPGDGLRRPMFLGTKLHVSA